jgi:hypothetical protein
MNRLNRGALVPAMIAVTGTAFAVSIGNINLQKKEVERIRTDTVSQTALSYKDIDSVKLLLRRQINVNQGFGYGPHLFPVLYKNNMSLVENNILMANTVQRILSPILYSKQLEPYVQASLEDIRYGQFRNAEQFLNDTSKKAKTEGNMIAIDEINLAYNYIRIAMVTQVSNAVVEVNRKSAEKLSVAFIRDSRRIYDSDHVTKSAIYNIPKTIASNKYTEHSDKKDWAETLHYLEILIEVCFGIGTLSYIGDKINEYNKKNFPLETELSYLKSMYNIASAEVHRLKNEHRFNYKEVDVARVDMEKAGRRYYTYKNAYEQYKKYLKKGDYKRAEELKRSMIEAANESGKNG